MLKHLLIKNYALIRNLEIEPSQSLNVITGETGAGKSIMLGALGLLLGNRADSKVLLNDQEKCVTEGTFQIGNYGLKKLFKQFDLDYSDSTVIRREIAPGGKSRAFINDTPVTLDIMKAIGNKLMDIHSQHETLDLGKRIFQLHLIDTYAQNGSVMEKYEETWNDFVSKEKAYHKLISESEKLKQESDYIKFQLKELSDLNLIEGEEDKLEQDVKLGENAEDIKSKLSTIISSLSESENSTLNSLSETKSIFNSILSFSRSFENLYKRLESIRVELDDIIGELETEKEKIDYDPEQLAIWKERLDNINRLLRKHNSKSTKELLAIQNGLEIKANKSDNLEDELKRSKKDLNEVIKELNNVGNVLSETRKKTLNPISKQLVKNLQSLGIPQAAIEINHKQVSPSNNGIDEIEINFSANKGVSPKPLAEVASGGEFSRLMFSIKYIMAEKASLPTLILDEIDSGVSGEIAVSLGKMMKEMSNNHQVISISHLPQIAAKADHHFMVYKDDKAAPPATAIKKLDEHGRIEEIAKMIGGSKPSNIALQNAKELIES